MRLNPEALNRAMSVRAIDGASLARLARVSPTTISSARAGKNLKVGTARKIAVALAKVDVIPELDQLAEPAITSR
jgi:hypothetical protein